MPISHPFANVTFPALDQTNNLIAEETWLIGLGLLPNLTPDQGGWEPRDWSIQFGEIEVLFPLNGPPSLKVLKEPKSWPGPYRPLKPDNGAPSVSWLLEVPGESLNTWQVDETAMSVVEAERTTVAVHLKEFAANPKLQVLALKIDKQTVHLWKSPHGIQYTLSS